MTITPVPVKLSKLQILRHRVVGWWLRSLPRKWIRDFIGVTDDIESGMRFMRLTTANMENVYKLVRGLRADLEATNTEQNPVNELVGEVVRRLKYYEKECATLAYAARQLAKLDKEAAEREAVTTTLDEEAASAAPERDEREGSDDMIDVLEKANLHLLRS